jgi:hypothetical protein
VVIDFDWSGKHLEGKYPNHMNQQIAWPNGCRAEAFLDFAHDEAWASRFFA